MRQVLWIVFLFFGSIIMAQPCGSFVYFMDRQIVMPDNHLILLNTSFTGELMKMYSDEKEIRVRYAIFSPEGELIKDSTMELAWKDMHYNYWDCICTYNPHYPIDEAYNKINSDKGECPIYFPYFYKNVLILSYFLRGDRRNIYEVSIKNTGENNWKRYDMDSLSFSQGAPNAFEIKTETNKSMFFKSFLDEKYQSLMTPQRTKLKYDSIRKSYAIIDKDITLIPLSKKYFFDWKSFSEINEKNSYRLFLGGKRMSNVLVRQKENFLERLLKNENNLHQLPKYIHFNFDTITPSKKFLFSFISPPEEYYPKYMVSGKNWNIVLNGSILIHGENKPPLIDLKDNMLFVTVFNDDYENCPGYGKDVYPIVYCIDIEKGKILWHKML